MTSLHDENPFAFRITKDGRVLISWYGKQVVTLKGVDARKFQARVERASSEEERQLLMARVTGNFKRGNERA